MKSALELAMEKTNKAEGENHKPLTDAQKEEIAEARSIAKAKIAESEIMLNDKLALFNGRPDVEAVAIQARQEFAQDRDRAEAQAERTVEMIKNR